jgi:hypothetical protein
MRLVATPEATEFVADTGGRLFLSLRSGRCCRSVTWLDASTDADDLREWRKVAGGGFEVFVSDGLSRLPDELHVELRRFPRRRVEAYWDGCAYVL